MAVMARHGRTFRLAARLLPADAAADAAVIYAFCREVDDVADEGSDPVRAEAELRAIRDEIDGASPRPGVAAFLEVAQRRGLDLFAARHLVDAITGDCGAVRVRDDRALLSYCYGVAGTVGILMTPILGVTDPRALPHAVDLGIAMQLTNLCRDVREDALRNRVYLPCHRLREQGVDPEAIIDASPASVARVVKDLLHLADAYYRSAVDGLPYIPWRTRIGIHVALAVYRAIGVKLLRTHGGDALAGRVVVRPLARIGWAIRALGRALVHRTTRPHALALHAALPAWPGVDRPW
jgi:phytoene synthase